MSFKSRNFKKTLALMLSVASIGGGAKNAANAAQKRGENSSQSQSWIAKNPGMTALIGILGLGTLAGGGYFVKNKFFSKNTKNNNNLGNDNVPNINIQPKIIANIANKDDFQNINLENIENQSIKGVITDKLFFDYEKVSRDDWDKMDQNERNEFINKKNNLKKQISAVVNKYSKTLTEKLLSNVVEFSNTIDADKKSNCEKFYSYFVDSNNVDVTTKNDLDNNTLVYMSKNVGEEETLEGYIHKFNRNRYFIYRLNDKILEYTVKRSDGSEMCKMKFKVE